MKREMTDRKMKELRDAFPSMPDSIRQMLAAEVKKQTGMEKDLPKTGRKRIRRTVLLAAASAAILTSAVAAAVKLGLSFSTSQVGRYGLEIKVEGQKEETDQTEPADTKKETGDGKVIAGTAAWEAPEEVPVVEIKASYIPEGMISYDDGLKIGYEDSLWQGGISMHTVVMDEEDTGNSLLTEGVADSQQIKVGDHETVLLELIPPKGSNGNFNRRIYVMYPEVWQILAMYVAEDVSLEEALKVAEGISLVPTGETTPIAQAWTWSDMAAPDIMVSIPKKTADRSELDLHQTGETFTLSRPAENLQGEYISAPLEVNVSSVQVADDLSLTEGWQDSPFRDRWEGAADEMGALLPGQLQYIRTGDGIESVDQVVKTEEIGQKLVYTTVEYTNPGEEPVQDVLFNGSLMRLIEEGDTFTVYDRSKQGEEQDWDRIEQNGPGGYHEMQYYDVYLTDGRQNGTNFISSIQPGETVTIHMAWIVNEDELEYLFLDLSGGNGVNFSQDQAGKQVLVDIRQR